MSSDAVWSSIHENHYIICSVEDLSPGSSSFKWITKFRPCQGWNSCPPDQVLEALAKELASPLGLSGSRKASQKYNKDIYNYTVLL
jgi:hypothetical protein